MWITFCLYVAEIALDGIQVYSTCADSKIKQSLEDFIREKVILGQLATFQLHGIVEFDFWL